MKRNDIERGKREGLWDGVRIPEKSGEEVVLEERG